MQGVAEELQAMRSAQDEVIKAFLDGAQENKGETSIGRVEIKNIRKRDQNLKSER